MGTYILTTVLLGALPDTSGEASAHFLSKIYRLQGPGGQLGHPSEQASLLDGVLGFKTLGKVYISWNLLINIFLNW